MGGTMKKIILLIAFLFLGRILYAQQWYTQDLHPPIAGTFSQVLGVSDKVQVGALYATNGIFASSWNGTPAGFLSHGNGSFYATDGTQYVGTLSNAGIGPFAAVWANGVTTFLAQPPKTVESHAYAVYGKVYGGYYIDTLGSQKAVFWPTRNTAVVMHPTNYQTSAILGVTKYWQVGQICNPNYPDCEAAVWHLSASSVRSLHPPGYTGSTIRALSGNTGVGWTVDSFWNLRATTWDLVSGAFKDVHPPGHYSSGINAVYRNLAVGGDQPTTFDPYHAYLWDLNNAANNIDLHYLLPVGQYSNSAAFAIWRDSTGNIFVGGYATSVADGQWHAMLWYTQPPGW
jgi:hypothetical protein